jgi:multicomponent Na+:H+ antiporter subunit E
MRPRGAWILSKNTLFIIILLTIVWIILNERLTILTAVAGIVISVCCVGFCNWLLPFPELKTIKLFRLALYPFYLIGQMYLAAFNSIEMILKGADVVVIDIKTKISNHFLQTILANSITLTPCSISLDLKDDTITVIWLKGKTKASKDSKNEAEPIKDKLEKMLLKAEG